MHLFNCLVVLGLAATTAVAAAPPGYHAPRRRYTPRGLPYHRPGLRLHLSTNLGYYNGDLTGRAADNTARVGYGVGLTQTLSPHFTFTADVSRVQLQAQDETHDRGYAFEGSNGVLSALLRYNLFADKSLYAGLGHTSTPLLVFVQAGAAGLLYNPVATQYGRALAPEAGNKYPQAAAAFPVGGGVTWHPSPRLYLTLDARYYLTTTDLLDDISQRGNPKLNDSFGTLALQLEYAFGHKKPRPLTHYD